MESVKALMRAVSRNNGVPPAPPTFRVTATTASSITLAWEASMDGGSPLIGYRIHYHREFGDWELVEVGPEEQNFTLDNLKCGTNYQFYIQVRLSKEHEMDQSLSSSRR